MFLTRDAVAPSALPLPDHAARRFCDRLIEDLATNLEGRAFGFEGLRDPPDREQLGDSGVYNDPSVARVESLPLIQLAQIYRGMAAVPKDLDVNRSETECCVTPVGAKG